VVSVGELGGAYATAMAWRTLGGYATVKEKARKAKWEAQGSAGECGLDVVRFGLALPRWEGRW